MSARSILSAMDTQHYEIVQIGIAPDGSWWTGENVLGVFLNKGDYSSLQPVTLLPDPAHARLYRLAGTGDIQPVFEAALALDVVFPVLHGTFGEDGTLQGLLELADIAYVGAGVLGSALGMDKGVFRDVMRANQIPVVDTLVIPRSEIESSIDAVIQRGEALSDYPLFVKPANLGSSVGITRCINRSDLLEGLIEAARYDRRVLVERGLDAREIEVSVLGNQDPIVSLPGEIIPSREYYSYEAKYIDESSRLIIPAPISAQLAERVRALALKAYQAADCAGMGRVDFLLEKKPPPGSDGLYLSEINTIPGFTTISMYPKLWEASGLAYPVLIDRLIELALRRKAERDHTERRYLRET
jgi:D-alanine-D-alanine ligase